MAIILLDGIRRSLPIIRLDGKDYFLLGGTYSRLVNETQTTEMYTEAEEGDFQSVVTDWHRFQMTILAPLSASYISYQASPGSFTFGDLGTLHTTLSKKYPEDGLEYYDVSALENFSGTYTHLVFATFDWEAPHNNDPGLWQVPIKLWGQET